MSDSHHPRQEDAAAEVGSSSDEEARSFSRCPSSVSDVPPDAAVTPAVEDIPDPFETLEQGGRLSTERVQEALAVNQVTIDVRAGIKPIPVATWLAGQLLVYLGASLTIAVVSLAGPSPSQNHTPQVVHQLMQKQREGECLQYMQTLHRHLMSMGRAADGVLDSTTPATES